MDKRWPPPPLFSRGGEWPSPPLLLNGKGMTTFPSYPKRETETDVDRQTETETETETETDTETESVFGSNQLLQETRRGLTRRTLMGGNTESELFQRVHFSISKI